MPGAHMESSSSEGDVQVMADTGENRQIVGRANAKEAETVRASKRAISEERSTAKASNAEFHNAGRGLCRIRGPGGGRNAPAPS
jgi:hypothetical protein